jgi:predicted nucleotidyltransferase
LPNPRSVTAVAKEKAQPLRPRSGFANLKTSGTILVSLYPGVTGESMMITEEQINQIVNAIMKGYQPQKIILFGSYAHGNPTYDSDIDLLVIKDDDLPKIQRNRVVRSYLKDFSFPVDIIVKSSQEFEMFKDVIGTVVYTANKYGRVLYG